MLVCFLTEGKIQSEMEVAPPPYWVFLKLIDQTIEGFLNFLTDSHGPMSMRDRRASAGQQRRPSHLP